MISEVHENLLGKFAGGGGRAMNGDPYGDGTDGDQFYNAVIDERPTRDLGLNNNNRNLPFGATP